MSQSDALSIIRVRRGANIGGRYYRRTFSAVREGDERSRYLNRNALAQVLWSLGVSIIDGKPIK